MKTKPRIKQVASASATLSLGLIAGQAWAGTIVVEDHVLATARAPYQQKCQTSWGSGIFGNLFRKMCLESYEAKNIANLQLSGGTVRQSAVMPAPIPESVERESYVISNCTSSVRREKNSYSVTFEEGSEVTTSQSVKSSTKADLNVKFSVFDFSTGGAREVVSSDESKRSYKKTVTRTAEIDEQVQPFTALILDIEQRLSNAYLDFDGDVRVEADLGAFAFKFSQLVPNNVLTIKGQLWNSTARSLSKSFREVKLDPVSCARINGLQARREAEPARPALAVKADTRPDDLRAYGRDGVPLQVVPEVVAYRPGMTLMTADVMSAVQVRTRALGTTHCGATFHVNGTDTSLLAPAGEWSRWHNVAFVPGWRQLVIDSSSQCAAGLQAEVRYVKP